MPEETRNDILLRRIQITLAILASLAGIAVGIYNVKKIYFEKPAPPPAPSVQQPDKIRSALDDFGATMIQKIKEKND
jgi:hypothetical protein